MCLLHEDAGDEPLLRETLVGLGVHLRLLVIGVDAGELRLLRQQLVLQLHAQVLERGFRRLEGQTRVQRFLLDLRVAQFEDDGLGLHLRAWTQQDSLDAAVSVGRQPAGVLGDERAEAADLAHERPALHRVDEQRGAIDGRRRRLHARERDGDEGDDHEDRHRIRAVTQSLASKDGRVAGKIHHGLLLAGSGQLAVGSKRVAIQRGQQR